MRAKYLSIINAIDKDQHRRKRKFIGPALTERSMRTFGPIMAAQIGLFLKQQLYSASHTGTPVDMTERCQRIGVDVVGLLAFDAMSWRISTYMQF
ncbi:Uu.00g033710.m01.CDS01 [Anthostomella pinea]|uniref:Uu.00g033710.m01.CDS01 n=1 Tax=Anthostomella pinea TaxID=933095 RepID=A0AAI8V902_9PEZI|nr:Uu.00g033710.m01.CDS01 [Anthostomella pinea]